MLDKKHELALITFLEENPNAELLQENIIVRSKSRRNFNVILDCGYYVVAEEPNFDSEKPFLLNYAELDSFCIDNVWGSFPENRRNFSKESYLGLTEMYFSNLSNTDKYDLLVYLSIFAPRISRVSKSIEILNYKPENFCRLVDFNSGYIPDFGRHNYKISCDSRFHRDNKIVFDCLGTRVSFTLDQIKNHYFDIHNRISTKTAHGDLSSLTAIELSIYYRTLGYNAVFNPNTYEWTLSKAFSTAHLTVEHTELLNFHLITNKLINTYYLEFLNKTLTPRMIYFEDAFSSKSYKGDLYQNLSPLEDLQLLVIGLMSSCSNDTAFFEIVDAIKRSDFTGAVKTLTYGGFGAHLFKMKVQLKNNGFEATFPNSDNTVNGVYSPSFDLSCTWKEFTSTLSDMLAAIEYYPIEELTIFELCLLYRMKFISVFPISENEFSVLDDLNMNAYKIHTFNKEEILNLDFVLATLRS